VGDFKFPGVMIEFWRTRRTLTAGAPDEKCFSFELRPIAVVGVGSKIPLLLPSKARWFRIRRFGSQLRYATFATVDAVVKCTNDAHCMSDNENA
jgi:hypothetical protein